MAVLDVSGLWSEGDDYRLIKALLVPFGTYTLNCIASCMNDLQAMSTTAQQDVLDLLTSYETAETVQETTNLADTEGKTLIQADVLSWSPDGTDKPSGPQRQMMADRAHLQSIFAFCTCLGGLQGETSYTTVLIRS